MTEPSEVKKDFIVSWKMLKLNYKAFLATELFASLSVLIVFSLLIGIVSLIYFLAPALSLEDLRSQLFDYPRHQIYIIETLFFALAYILLVGLLYCQYGLSYDIMSTGDLFSEFKRAFWYFKRYWWQYLLLSFISGLGLFIPVGSQVIKLPNTIGNVLLDSSLIIVRYLLLFVFFIISSIILPSLTAQGSLKNSFTEASRIIKKYPKRLFKTWIRFFLMFLLPIIILILISYVLFFYFSESGWQMPISNTYLVFIVTYFVFNLVFLFLAIPLSTLIATRIYNSVDIEKFSPQKEDIVENKTEKTEEEENSEK